jgi:hypothetical protein
MFQRNRIVRVAIALLVALALAAPAPTFAARLPEARLSPAAAWEMAWSWLTRLLLPVPGAAPRLTSQWEKEGGIIDPNGGTPPNPGPPPPVRLRAGGGNS